FGIHPGRMNHALVELRGGQTRRCSRLAGCGRIERAGVIHSPRQNGGPKLRRKWQEMIDFDAIEVGQAFAISQLCARSGTMVLPLSRGSRRMKLRQPGPDSPADA